MKRIVSISVVVLANIILLAHAIIPHHHHDGVATAWLQQECQYHHHQPTDSHSQEEDTSDDCILKVVLSRLSVSHREESEDHNLTPCLHCFDLYCTDFHLPEPVMTGKAVKAITHLTSTYSYSPVNTSGLRAPPYVSIS